MKKLITTAVITILLVIASVSIWNTLESKRELKMYKEHITTLDSIRISLESALDSITNANYLLEQDILMGLKEEIFILESSNRVLKSSNSLLKIKLKSAIHESNILEYRLYKHIIN